jgi:hypothetical protein
LCGILHHMERVSPFAAAAAAAVTAALLFAVRKRTIGAASKQLDISSES